MLNELIKSDGKCCDSEQYMYYIDSLGNDIVQSCLSTLQEAIQKCTVKKGKTLGCKEVS